MSLPHVLLGLLRVPATGYELRQTFASGATHYWGAQLSQIYPTLKKLEAAGHVRSEEAPSDRGPRRFIYHRTQAGVDELCDWIRSGPITGTQRLAYLAQIEFAHETGDTTATSFLISELRQHFEPLRDLLATGVTELSATEAAEGLDLQLFHELLALQLGVRTLDARLAWCDEAEALIAGRN